MPSFHFDSGRSAFVSGSGSFGIFPAGLSKSPGGSVVPEPAVAEPALPLPAPAPAELAPAVPATEPLPLALTKPISRERECPWRRAALPRLEEVGKAYRVIYTSRNSAALSAAVLAGLAVSVFPESAIRPGMRVLGTADGIPARPSFDIGLLRNPHETSDLADALAMHIVQGLDNLADAEAAE